LVLSQFDKYDFRFAARNPVHCYIQAADVPKIEALEPDRIPRPLDLVLAGI